MDYFWTQLIRLNNNLFVIEQILHFPFNLFFGSMREAPFFFLVRENFLDMSALIVNRLLNDDTKRSYTLRAFKNKVIENTESSYKTELAQQTSQIDFGSLELILKKVRNIRNTRIAHAEDDFAYSLDEKAQLAVTDLMILRDKINDLFNLLSFKERWGKIYFSYDVNVAEADIVKVLDSLAFNNPLLSLPEKNPEYWLYHRDSLTEDEIRQINHYRWKLGWPKV